MFFLYNGRYGEEALFTDRDIYNIRVEGRFRDRGGLLDFATFIFRLRRIKSLPYNEDKAGYVRFNWADEAETDLLDVFWSYYS